MISRFDISQAIVAVAESSDCFQRVHLNSVTQVSDILSEAQTCSASFSTLKKYTNPAAFPNASKEAFLALAAAG